jgi:hypothetical protein
MAGMWRATAFDSGELVKKKPWTIARDIRQLLVEISYFTGLVFLISRS